MNAAKTGGCTSGFGINISGAPRLLTAGHCWPEDTKIVNLKFSGSGTIGSGNAMGTVILRGSGNDVDAEVFTGCNGSGTCGGTGAIWTGVLGSPQVTSVAGVGSWSVGDKVCVSGAYGGEKCGLTVQKINICRTISGKDYCRLTQLSGTDMPTEGDSGGPAYRRSNGYALAVGTDTAGNDVDTEFITSIHAELDQFGASLIHVN
jgi:hypothetical protein